MEKTTSRKISAKDFFNDKEENFYWYILYVANGHEFDVEKIIRDRMIQLGYSDFVKEVFIPIERIQVRRNKSYVMKDECVYGGYVCVCMKLNRILIDKILDLKYVFRFLLSSNKYEWPYLLEEDEINAVKRFVKKTVSKNKYEQHEFKEGEEVKIVTGLFTDMKGIISKIKKDSICIDVYPFSQRVRSVKTEVKAEDIAPTEE